MALRKKYLKAKKQLEKIQLNSSQWKINPSEVETKILLKQLENNSFFGRIKLKKRWREISTLPFSEAKRELSSRLVEMKEINHFSEIIIKFCELNIENPEIEVPQIFQTLHAYSENEWKKIALFSEEKKSLLTNSHRELDQLHRDLKHYFRFDSMDKLSVILQKIKADLGKIIPIKKALSQLDEKAFYSFKRCSSFEQFQTELFSSHWVQFQTKFPAFSNFKMEDIKGKINDVLLAEKKESKLFAQQIENSIHKTFVEYNELLTVPARKLTSNLKEKKVRLRRGKSILIKEFSKTRSHPSLRELQNSDAREWIELLKPIWLSNPTQLAKCFPMETDIFDVAIFDEASQIPLQNALGTIQRSGRIIVAGDEHQMGPTSYFSRGSNEQMDLLHQANYYWDKVDLKHHYRSLHPELIAFSNQHFYKNELKAFPSFPFGKALHHHFVEDGTFVDRKNENEAKKVASYISSAIEKEGSIGIVAFSEEQLNCIWQALSPEMQLILSERIEQNKAFFKALENVQGDECDELIISFGYGKNESNDFYMRFGPMNTLNGRKRLNVLLTRARKEIHFFCSVKSSEFKLSENESINLLKKWIAFSESTPKKSSIQFPFDLSPDIKDNQLCFYAIQEKLPFAKEVTTLQSVLESRGWNVSYS